MITVQKRLARASRVIGTAPRFMSRADSWRGAAVVMNCGVLALTLVLGSACGTPMPPPPDGGANATIGAEGGRLAVPGLTLEVPPGAVAAATAFRVTRLDTPPPEPLTAFSPVFRLEPAGISFARPVRLTIEYQGDPRPADFFATVPGDTTGVFVRVGGRLEGGRMVAQLHHFTDVTVASQPTLGFSFG